MQGVPKSRVRSAVVMVITSKNILYMGFTSIIDHFEDMGAMGFKKSHKAGGAQL